MGGNFWSPDTVSHLLLEDRAKEVPGSVVTWPRHHEVNSVCSGLGAQRTILCPVLGLVVRAQGLRQPQRGPCCHPA